MLTTSQLRVEVEMFWERIDRVHGRVRRACRKSFWNWFEGRKTRVGWVYVGGEWTSYMWSIVLKKMWNVLWYNWNVEYRATIEARLYPKTWYVVTNILSIILPKSCWYDDGRVMTWLKSLVSCWTRTLLRFKATLARTDHANEYNIRKHVVGEKNLKQA